MFKDMRTNNLINGSLKLLHIRRRDNNLACVSTLFAHSPRKNNYKVVLSFKPERAASLNGSFAAHYTDFI